MLSLFVAFHLLVFASLGLSLTQRSARFSDSSWMGLFSNPNLLGPVATFGIVAAFGLRRTSNSVEVRLISSACIAADIMVAIKATSTTSWIALALCAVSFGGVRLTVALRSRGVSAVHLRVATIAGAAVGTTIVATSSRPLASLVGKESSLVARRDVWGFVMDAVRQRPFTGYGFASFWDDPDNIATQYDRIGRLGAYAHSTFVEALLLIGIVGFALLVVVVVFSVGRVWWTAIGNTEWSMAWWAAAAMFALVENLAESMFLYHSIFWVLLIAPGFAALRHTIDGVNRPRRIANTRRRSLEEHGRF
jgi:O-antigen ligase